MPVNPLHQSMRQPVLAEDALRQFSGLENTLSNELKSNALKSNELESDEPPLESDLHRELIDLLLSCLRWWWRDRDDFYATGNLTIYDNPNQLTNRDFRGPDFFVVLGAEKRPRKSWMVWQEDYRYPNVIVEFLSESTAKTDRTTKKILYQDTFKTPEYFWFHPETLEFVGFRRVNAAYQPIEPDGDDRLWSEQLQLYLGIYQHQLRLLTSVGELIPSPAEQTHQAEQRSQHLEAFLRSIGIDPDRLPEQ